jgi:hypothetical protein
MVQWLDDDEPVPLEYNRADPRSPMTPREFQQRARDIGALIKLLLLFVWLTAMVVAACYFLFTAQPR